MEQDRDALARARPPSRGGHWPSGAALDAEGIRLEPLPHRPIVHSERVAASAASRPPEAERLDISSRSAAANILAKLGVHSQPQAVLFALRYGAVDVR